MTSDVTTITALRAEFEYRIRAAIAYGAGNERSGEDRESWVADQVAFAIARARADGLDDGKVRVPRPHVPHGPARTPELLADADYLEQAARNLADGFPVGGYGVTTTVIALLQDTAAALRFQHDNGTGYPEGVS